MTEHETHERLFSYGTLQLASVQRATFGRLLDGVADVMPGYALMPLAIDDPHVVAVSGLAQHTMAVFTGLDVDTIAGTVFALTPAELASADAYEVDAVERVAVTLASGMTAWVYMARSGPHGESLTNPRA